MLDAAANAASIELNPGQFSAYRARTVVAIVVEPDAWLLPVVSHIWCRRVLSGRKVGAPKAAFFAVSSTVRCWRALSAPERAAVWCAPSRLRK